MEARNKGVSATKRVERSKQSLIQSRGEIWKKMVVDGKLQQSANAETMFNTKQRVHLVKCALSDSGASSHFLKKGTPAVNIEIAAYPLSIKLPDGSIIWSRHTCNLDIP